jgi:hypothetical protein
LELAPDALLVARLLLLLFLHLLGLLGDARQVLHPLEEAHLLPRFPCWGLL